jgi:hypothetical protein
MDHEAPTLLHDSHCVIVTQFRRVDAARGLANETKFTRRRLSWES